MQEPPSPEEKKAAQREYHRLRMARTRVLESSVLEAQRPECRRLSEELTALLAARRERRHQQRQQELQHSSPIDVGDSRGLQGNAGAITTPISALLDKFAQAVELKNEMLLQHQELKKAVGVHYVREAKVDGFAREMLALNESSRVNDKKNQRNRQRLLQPDAQAQHPNLAGYWTRFTENEEPFYYEPVSISTCREFIRAVYPSLLNHHQYFVRGEQSPEAIDFFGWKLQSFQSFTAGDQQVHFHFSKSFPTVDSAALVAYISGQAWEIFSTPELYEKLYRTHIVMQVLQRVDHFTNVALVNTPSTDHSLQRRCLLLACQVADVDDNGQQSLGTLMIAVNPQPAMLESSADVQFIRDTHMYLLLHPRVDEYGYEYVEMTFGGHGNQPSEAYAQYVFIEIAFALFRFEQQVLPQNLVTSSEWSEAQADTTGD
ncbi:hypothetical protein BBJ28_00023113 [Nothophytophthora sp. Chile5]|nr:hypothetical protein BBJ28_00023113 [Nothophytophthora sp. Chile5]